MALPPGTRLGVYEVVAQIGEGGMGQVYRATDTKLRRQVALKILPPSFAADRDRLARFQREAEVLASLNHPNIAAIYGLEESRGLTALVLELVEGDDLFQRIARGRLPFDEALLIARQIAEALEAAHEQGIIHRDLKPANIKVRDDGTVKVLDFGLAKSMDPASNLQPDLTNSPTITSPAMMTGVGIILGTAAYMSPEQAKGRPADKRSDVWAFGCVLYEMLTGTRAFEGEDVSDTLARILMNEPDWTALSAAAPPTVITVLRRCLQRDRKQRLRDIGDVSLALEGAFETAVPQSITERPGPKSAAARAVAWVSSAAALAFATAWLIVWAPWRAQTPPYRRLSRLDIDLGADVSLPAPGGSGSSVAVSPDGLRLAYVSGTPARLFTRRLDQPKATELPGTLGAMSPFFSPDGQWIGFVARNKLNKISVEGGTVVAVADVPNSTFLGASWSEDGNILLGDYSGLLRVPAGGGRTMTVAGLGPGELLRSPQLLPGGRAILFSAHSTPDVDKFTIEVLTLADHKRKIIGRGGESPHYLPASSGMGHLVYVNKSALFAIPFDLDKLETRGTAVPVLDDVAYQASSSVGQFALSPSGILVYRRAGSGSARLTTLQWVDPAGKKEPLRDIPSGYINVSLSPDGKRVALVVADGASQDVWVYDPQRDSMTRLTFGDAVYLYPRWSPDGQYVLFSSGGNGIYQARADGASRPRPLTQSKTAQFPWSFTPDGKRLAYDDLGVANWQIWTVVLEDQGGQLRAGQPEQLKSNFYDLNPSFSPDGRWLAYESNESGSFEVYVRAFPPSSSGQGGKWQISNGGGSWPRWSPNGHELLYRSGDAIMAASYMVRENAFVAEKSRVWIAKLGTNWDLAPDGKRVAVVMPVESATAPTQDHEVVLLQNFSDELQRRVPLGK